MTLFLILLITILSIFQVRSVGILETLASYPSDVVKQVMECEGPSCDYLDDAIHDVSNETMFYHPQKVDDYYKAKKCIKPGKKYNGLELYISFGTSISNPEIARLYKKFQDVRVRVHLTNLLEQIFKKIQVTFFLHPTQNNECKATDKTEKVISYPSEYCTCENMKLGNAMNGFDFKTSIAMENPQANKRLKGFTGLYDCFSRVQGSTNYVAYRTKAIVLFTDLSPTKYVFKSEVDDTEYSLFEVAELLETNGAGLIVVAPKATVAAWIDYAETLSLSKYSIIVAKPGAVKRVVSSILDFQCLKKPSHTYITSVYNQLYPRLSPVSYKFWDKYAVGFSFRIYSHTNQKGDSFLKTLNVALVNKQLIYPILGFISGRYSRAKVAVYNPKYRRCETYDGTTFSDLGVAAEIATSFTGDNFVSKNIMAKLQYCLLSATERGKKLIHFMIHFGIAIPTTSSKNRPALYKPMTLTNYDVNNIINLSEASSIISIFITKKLQNNVPVYGPFLHRQFYPHYHSRYEEYPIEMFFGVFKRADGRIRSLDIQVHKKNNYMIDPRYLFKETGRSIELNFLFPLTPKPMLSLHLFHLQKRSWEDFIAGIRKSIQTDFPLFISAAQYSDLAYLEDPDTQKFIKTVPDLCGDKKPYAYNVNTDVVKSLDSFFVAKGPKKPNLQAIRMIKDCMKKFEKNRTRDRRVYYVPFVDSEPSVFNFEDGEKEDESLTLNKMLNFLSLEEYQAIHIIIIATEDVYDEWFKYVAVHDYNTKVNVVKLNYLDALSHKLAHVFKV